MVMAMGRPKKGEELGASARVAMRIPDVLRQRLDALAAQHNRSLSDEVRHALEVYVGAASVKKGKGAKQ